MDLYNQRLMYEFHAKEIVPTEALRQFADQTVKEIKANAGWDSEVQINIEPEVKDKRLFSVCMSVLGSGEPIVIKKKGKQILSVLRKVRKGVLRKIHKLRQRRMTRIKRRCLRENWLHHGKEEEFYEC